MLISKSAMISEASALVKHTIAEHIGTRALRRGTKPKQRSKLAQSLIETMAGIIIIIPIGLFSYDLTYIVVANQNNELIADTAARAAANHGDTSSAQLAAQQAIDDFQQSANYGKTFISDFQYNVEGSGQVIVFTQLNAKLPVALANWTAVTISAKGVQPIVGVPIPR